MRMHVISRALAALGVLSLALAGCPNDGSSPAADAIDDATADGGLVDGAGADSEAPLDADDVADAADVSESGPDSEQDAGPVAPFCTPGTPLCAGLHVQAICGPDGASWVPSGYCLTGSVCDPKTAICVEVTCEAKRPVCDGDGGYATCNDLGTAVVPPALPCPAESTCVDGEGCVPWICQPGEPACDAAEGFGSCTPDGIAVTRVGGCPETSPCPLCEGLDQLHRCDGLAEGAPPVLTDCPVETSCVDDQGCLPWACTPDSALCDDDGALLTCSEDGQASAEAEPACSQTVCHHCLDLVTHAPCPGSGPAAPAVIEACAEAHSCVPDKGCQPWKCKPGDIGCNTAGAAAECAEDGQSWSPLDVSEPCTAATCSQCLTLTEYVVCHPGAGDAPSPVLTCPESHSCAPLKGCKPWICEPNETRCSGNTFERCSEDGLEWEESHCGFYMTCIPEGPDAGCYCGDAIGCELLQSCTPLPPMSSGGWTVPEDWQTLKIAFSVGLVGDGSQAHVNISPIVNGLTGEYVTDLVPAGSALPGGGTITVYEDGDVVDLKCVPLTDTAYAMTDIVFLMDVTGSMSGTIEKVKSSAKDLASFLVAAGQNVRFGVVPFDDYVPSEGGYVLDLTDDLELLLAFVDLLKASGGGDGPENALDAVYYALTELYWRKGSQKALVLMTDNVMHHPGDGTDYTAHGIVDCLSLLHFAAVVHTISDPESSNNPFPSNKFVEPRVLSCATGGTAADIDDFNQEEIEKALFAKALAQSYSCYYPTDAPFGVHDVTVEVVYSYGGAVMNGSAAQMGITYVP